MEPLATNIRFLLWQSGTKREQWFARFAELLGGDSERAKTLLEGRGGELQSDEKRAVAQAFKVNPKDLQSPNLIKSKGVDILAENVRFLVDGLPYGMKKEFASEMAIDVTTVSRWLSGAQRPTKTKLGRIARYFSLPSGVDLATDTIFLSTEPISGVQMKARLHEAIDRLDIETLRMVYPAITKLLK